MSGRLPYLPALDGLRAIAVTAVLLYHLELSWARGGFLGVDLFFVISGFLITTLLLGEHDATGRIALGPFWLRRFRRLVPPLVVVVAATVVATRLWGVPEQWASVRADAVAALAYVANWRFVLADQSYFDTLLGPSPLLHTWSLAVEEQWYLLWPLAMVGLVALARRRSDGVALVVVLAAALASAVWMAVLYDPVDASRVYFGTDTRAQQLLIGAALAWTVRLRPGALAIGSRARSAWAVVAGLVVFAAVAATTLDESAWLYRGGFFAISVLCALVVLGTATTTPAPALRWLTWTPLVWVGVRSYGIYLWHWPVFQFVGAPMGLELAGVPLMALQVAVTLVLTELSLRLVERPARTSSWRPAMVVGSWTTVAVGAIVAALVVLAPGAAAFSTATVFRPAALADGGDGPTEPSRSRSDDDAPAVVPAPDPTTTPDPAATPGLVDDTLLDNAPPAVTVPADPRPDVLILGDSTAAALWDRMAPSWADDWHVQLMARLGCGIFDGVTLDADSDRPNPHPDECRDWRNEWNASMYAVDPDVALVMVGAWEVLDQRIDGVDHRFPSSTWDAIVRGQFTDAIDIAAATGVPAVVMSVPCMEPSGDENTTARTDPARVAAVNRIIAEIAATRPDVHVADLGAVLCPGGMPVGELDGERVRYDGVHVSALGSDIVWRWLFPQLAALL
jgi:peptidoglycan/LPS O-acetylase OafA/YrhL